MGCWPQLKRELVPGLKSKVKKGVKQGQDVEELAQMTNKKGASKVGRMTLKDNLSQIIEARAP